MEKYTINYADKAVHGTLFCPSNERKSPAVIFSHGYNGIGSDFTRECEAFAENGFVSYAFDFCGGSTRSQSTGNSSDMTIFSEKEDLVAVTEHISKLDFVDSGRIFLLGGSQGGLVTALAAAEMKEKIEGVILYYPAFCIPDNWRHAFDETGIPEEVEFWGLKLGKRFFSSIKELYPFEVVPNYEGNVLIIHGDKDQIVPLDDSFKAEKIYKNCKTVVLSGEGHGFTESGTQSAIEHSLSFLKRLI